MQHRLGRAGLWLEQAEVSIAVNVTTNITLQDALRMFDMLFTHDIALTLLGAYLLWSSNCFKWLLAP